MSSPPPPTFKKRKPKLSAAGAGSSSSAAAAPTSTPAATGGASSDKEEEGPAVVVRSRGSTARGNAASTSSTAAARRAKASKALSFADGEDVAGVSALNGGGESSISAIKRSALSQGAPRLLPTTAPLASSTSSAAAAYSPAALAALKAATPTRVKLPLDTTLDADGDVAMTSTAATLEAPDLIPSAARVQEAKERRRRAAANGVSSGAAAGGGEDFISLSASGSGSASYAGPHPHSTLQREEDDLGDGADDHAAYTGALERVALGDEARAREARAKKAERRAAVEGLGREGSESEESAEEWEREQLKKMGLAGAVMPREPSPYRAATIPAISVLPSLTSASTRLHIRLVELDEAVKAHTQVRDDATRGLAQLEDEEAMNKQDVERAGEAEAWFRELENFILAVATFLESKTPALEAVEKTATATLAERTRLLQRARANAATDELSLFYGVPSTSLLPLAVSDDGTLLAEPSPAEDGEALSPTRSTRRAALLTSDPNTQDSLAPADQAAFNAAWSRLTLQLEALFEDVAAPEFRSPSAKHPASLVARFTAWRSSYAEEYAGAWGGLALASTWEFWARKEMGAWDALREAAGGGGVATTGPQGLDGFEWHAQLGEYVEEGPQPPIGGDEEAVGNVVTSVVVPLLVKRAEAGAYDVWSASETRGAIELVEQVGYVLERTGARFQSLITAHLAPFKDHITALHAALSTPPSHSAPSFHPLTAPARLTFLRRLLVLLRNLARWNRYITPPERASYTSLADTLVGAVMWPLLVEARETGGKDVAREIMSAVPPTLLPAEVGSRLSALAGGVET